MLYCDNRKFIDIASSKAFEIFFGHKLLFFQHNLASRHGEFFFHHELIAKLLIVVFITVSIVIKVNLALVVLQFLVGNNHIFRQETLQELKHRLLICVAVANTQFLQLCDRVKSQELNHCLQGQPVELVADALDAAQFSLLAQCLNNFSLNRVLNQTPIKDKCFYGFFEHPNGIAKTLSNSAFDRLFGKHQLAILDLAQQWNWVCQFAYCVVHIDPICIELLVIQILHCRACVLNKLVKHLLLS